MEVKTKIKPEVRFLNDMKEVLYDQKWVKTAPNLELYYMYRGVKPRRSPFGTLRDREKKELRYDITVIPPRMLGKEFVKTKGNRNSNNFPELYTVLKGKAILFTQKRTGETVKDVAVFKLKRGDWVIISPEDDVVTINPTKKILKTANWVSKKNENLYKELEVMRGGCYYYTKSGWIKNKNYKKLPELKFMKSLKKAPKNLDFLYGKR